MLLGKWLTRDIDRKETYREYNKTYDGNDRDCTDWVADCIFCKGERWRIWRRILERFKEWRRFRKHGQPRVADL